MQSVSLRAVSTLVGALGTQERALLLHPCAPLFGVAAPGRHARISLAKLILLLASNDNHLADAIAKVKR